jgi:hypothetical protein
MWLTGILELTIAGNGTLVDKQNKMFTYLQTSTVFNQKDG